MGIDFVLVEVVNGKVKLMVLHARHMHGSHPVVVDGYFPCYLASRRFNMYISCEGIVCKLLHKTSVTPVVKKIILGSSTLCRNYFSLIYVSLFPLF